MRGVGYLSPDSRGVPVGGLSSRRSAVGRFALVLMVLAAFGCHSTHVVGLRSDGAPSYEQAKVVYEVSTSRVDSADESDIELDYVKSHPLKAAIASRQASQTRSKPDEQPARLTIEYPHPNGDVELAHAIVELPDDDGVQRQVATSDLERHELDLLLVSLANGGTFETEQRPNGDSHVTVEIDGHSHSKRWTAEPRLERLAHETLSVSRSTPSR